MKQSEVFARLGKYEQLAYDEGFGADWLAAIGEELKSYVKDCMDNNKRITMSGFIRRIDELAEDRSMTD